MVRCQKCGKILPINVPIYQRNKSNVCKCPENSMLLVCPDFREVEGGLGKIYLCTVKGEGEEEFIGQDAPIIKKHCKGAWSDCPLREGKKKRNPMVGKLCECRYCGRKILVERGLFGVNHTEHTIAACWDCLPAEAKEKAKELYRIKGADE